MKPLFLFAALGLIVIAAPAPASGPFLLREQAWTAPGPRLAYDLTHTPGECLARRSPEIEIGRALFRSPALLGGPVARLGLSCDGCHADGSINTRFLLAELTDRPGHSDVTSEWASATRGDNIFNPKPIPDLAGVAGRSGFGAAFDPSLQNFTRGVIEEEFQGRRPPEQAFNGVIAYMRALNIRACPPDYAPLSLERAADDARRAFAAAQEADAETAPLVLLASQDAVRRIAERLPAAEFAAERQRLEMLSRELGAMREGDVRANLATAAPGWRARFDAAVARIALRESQTYFNEAALAAALAR